MKTITVRGLEPPLTERLKQKAAEEGKSVNQLIIDMLKAGLGLKKKAKHAEYHDMDHLFGKWTEDEFRQIQGKIDSERKIDRELWK